MVKWWGVRESLSGAHFHLTTQLLNYLTTLPYNRRTMSVADDVMDGRVRATLRNEQLRAVGQGVLETAGTTFIMLVAVRHFHATDMMKSLAGVNDKVGLIVSPLVVTAVMARGWRASKAAAGLMLIGGLGFAMSAAVPDLQAFV